MSLRISRTSKDARVERLVNTHLRLKGLRLLEDLRDLLPRFGVLLELSKDLLSHLLLLVMRNSIEEAVSWREKGTFWREQKEERERTNLRRTREESIDDLVEESNVELRREIKNSLRKKKMVRRT